MARADGYYIIARDASIHKLEVARWLTTDFLTDGDGEWLRCGSEVSLPGDDFDRLGFRVMSHRLNLVDLTAIPFPQKA